MKSTLPGAELVTSSETEKPRGPFTTGGMKSPDVHQVTRKTVVRDGKTVKAVGGFCAADVLRAVGSA